MTLARGSIEGYEVDRMVLKFSMMDGAREIPCAVSASAMDDMERGARTAPTQRRGNPVELTVGGPYPTAVTSRSQLNRTGRRGTMSGPGTGDPVLTLATSHNHDTVPCKDQW